MPIGQNLTFHPVPTRMTLIFLLMITQGLQCPMVCLNRSICVLNFLKVFAHIFEKKVDNNHKPNVKDVTSKELTTNDRKNYSNVKVTNMVFSFTLCLHEVVQKLWVISKDIKESMQLVNSGLFTLLHVILIVPSWRNISIALSFVTYLYMFLSHARHTCQIQRRM